MNGLYESACIIVLFPIIVAMGAGGTLTGAFANKICRFFGEISYPLYITHYPLIYVYTAWVTRDKVPAKYGAPMGVLLFVVAVTIAYACLKLYDEPVRDWLKRRYLTRSA
jgi:peptidoglycan/LPS O-acetylase OafA/YrhL